MHVSSNRVKMRISCEVSVGARRHAGLVLNVSPGGLFIQTFAKPTSGDTVRVALNVPGNRDAMSLDATVVWKRVVPGGLLRVAQGGVGLSLVNPPEGYYQFLAATARSADREPTPAMPTAAKPAPSAPTPAAPIASTAASGADGSERSERADSYKVRVRLGQRSRIVTVSAASKARAHEIALERVGAGWKVIASERCPA